jgi:hypothetical protein
MCWLIKQRRNIMATTPLVPQPTAATAEPVAPPWWIGFAINSGIVTLHQVLHNPHQAAYLKTTLLALRDTISATYPGE